MRPAAEFLAKITPAKCEEESLPGELPGRGPDHVVRKLRVYADTSVIGVCSDREFRGPSLNLMQRCARGEMTLVISAVSLQELERAPQDVRDVLQFVGADNIEVIAITDKIRELADRYVESGALGKGMRADAQHIAAATVSGVDVLASWNFRHMVNVNRIRQYSYVNRQMGYAPVAIRRGDQEPEGT